MKERLVFVLKIISAIVAAILGVLGASALSSCQTSMETTARHKGVGIFHYVDTIYTDGNLNLNLK